MDRFVHRLIEYWQSQGLRLAQPVDETEIKAFEHKYQLDIIPEFRTYLMTVNGMRQSVNAECDSNLFAFWPMDRIRPVAEECPESQSSPEERTYFVFADYMIWSWAYAVDLRANSPTAGRVVLLGGRREQCVSSTFSEFIELYIRDSPSIYALPA